MRFIIGGVAFSRVKEFALGLTADQQHPDGPSPS